MIIQPPISKETISDIPKPKERGVMLRAFKKNYPITKETKQKRRKILYTLMEMIARGEMVYIPDTDTTRITSLGMLKYLDSQGRA